MKKLSIILLACSMSVAAQAQVGFSDSLQGTSLTPYQWTPLYYTSTAGTSNYVVNFNDTSSPNGLAVGATSITTGAGRYVYGLFLNTNGANLPVGSMLEVDANWGASTRSSPFGIVVASQGSSLTPALLDGDDTRSQTQYLFAGITGGKTIGSIVSGGYDSGLGGAFTVTGSPATGSGGTTGTLGIARTAANQFSIYYDFGSGMTLLGTQTMSVSDVGNYIGFYADIEGNSDPALGWYNNLRIVAVPEPTSLALMCLGLATAFLIIIPRKKWRHDGSVEDQFIKEYSRIKGLLLIFCRLIGG